MVGDRRPPLHEWLSLFQSTVATEGITTGPGAVTGDSIVDARLAGSGANSFFSMLMVLYPGQPRLVDSMDITGFTDITGEVILGSAYKGIAAAIPAGVPYKIVTFRFTPAEVAALVALVTALMADVGDASTSALGSLFGILGDPAVDFATTLAAIIGALAAIPTENYFEQTCLLKMNSTQTLTNAAGDKNFIASNVTGAVNLISTDDAKVQRVTLIIIGRAVNSYAGNNALDCTTGTHNQWRANLDDGVYADLTNEEADGQMLDNDWPCIGEGAIHPFTFGFDVTALVTNIDGKIGVMLENGRSEQDGLIVICDIYLKVLYRL